MTIHKILIIGPSWVGDMVMAQVLFKVLKHNHPDCVLDILAPEWSRALTERMPEINTAVSMPIGHGQLALRKRYQIGRQLRKQHYDQVIVLPNSLKSALIPIFAAIPIRTGWRGEMRFGLLNDIRWLDKEKLPLMIQRFAALGIDKSSPLPESLPWPELLVSQPNQNASLLKFNLSTEKPILALCPGAEFGPSKRWPEQYYAEIAKYYLANNYQVWLFGSKNDGPVAEQIQLSTQNRCVNLTGSTNLGEAIDLLALAQLVISNDSGLMHVAAALKRPLVAIYGSTDPRFTPPLSSEVKIVSLGLSCSPCFKRECPLGHLKCLNDLTPEFLLTTINNMSTPKTHKESTFTVYADRQ